MTKEEVIAFLTEQRDLRLVGYEWGKDNLSDFERWQLAQANMFLDVIEWIEEVTSGDNTRNN
ncbi:hypothetical protein MP619_04810 [Streptococcus dysgalactiae]|uniref:Uncharacterized protein n=1 Tax=Streptococcus dysgalactiae TaxID=1334 RepID=A0AAF0A253_STRDY|nr:MULTISPECIES: hypothetical protein [Streptococcus]MBY5043779.1 hypothetical protein [Streptococcus agalactiae]MBY5047240.1 hypothetical protein [Streptococcus agalactiae]MBY5057569.1 hypothetical protein [Streptococcus agalactiae]ODG95456.1 hypothetical protein TH70_0261 [Streptococcus agalactiae]QGH04822.1 hypothetical protein EA458_10430 [Streptococcus dysgalactiae subsp. dysgalactiae]